MGWCWWGSASLWAQGDLVNNGANIVVNNGITLRVEGAIEQQNNSNINNTGSIYLKEDWTQTGATTTYTGTGSIHFEGTALQRLNSTVPLTINQLTINNNNRLQLNNDVTIATQINLNNNSSVELGTSNLTLQPTATISGTDVSHYIITNNNGRLRQTVSAVPTLFPVGRANYNPTTLTNIGVTDVFAVRVREEALQDGITGLPFTEEVVNRTWDIDEAVVGGSNLTVTLEWETSQELLNFDRLDAGLMHYTSGAWDRSFAYGAANLVSPNRYQITGTGITTFSPFAVTTRPSNLPIELLSFEATRKTVDEVQLDWVTAVEINNQGFEIQRLLEVEATFATIAFVEGNGTTTATSYYDEIDENSYTGVTYYRLKQLDFDGTYSYSPIRAVNGTPIHSTAAIQAYPNPTLNVLYIKFPALAQENIKGQLLLTDVQGHLLYETALQVSSHQRWSVDKVADLLPGTYFLMVELEDGQHFSQQFTKNEY